MNQKQKKYLQFSLIGVASLFIGKYMINHIRSLLINRHYESIKIRKRKLINEQMTTFKEQHQGEINLICQNLNKKVLTASVSQLKQMIIAKDITITQTLLIFIFKAIEVNLKLNALSDVLFIEAYEQARAQDKMMIENSNIINQYPLFGIPISIKDLLPVKGTDSTFGAAARCFKPDDNDCYLVAVVRKAGGIIFCKTNMPQIGKSLETSNFIFGTTNNPHDLLRTSGGSSGGEAALIAAHGSVLGLGSDLGGSLRIPAAFCGITSIKPSVGRWHRLDKSKLPIRQVGWTMIPTTGGPMARCVDDLIIMMQVQQEYYNEIPNLQKDLAFRPVPFDLEILKSKKKLKIGVIKSLSIWPAADSIIRGISEVSELLQNNGHEVVEYDIPYNFTYSAMHTFYELAGGIDDKGEIFEEMLCKEKPIPAFKLIKFMYTAPSWLKSFIVNYLNFTGNERQALLLSAISKPFKGTDVLHKIGQAIQLTEQFKQQWEEANLDAILLPVCGTVAVKHNATSGCLLMGTYSTLFNLLNYTCGTLPVTNVKGNEQNYKYNRDKMDKLTRDQMINSEGLPVSVQIVTRPFEEELCLNIMKQIENGVKYKYTF